MKIKLNIWATLFFGPLYVGWKGFLKEGLLHLLAELVLSFLFIDIIFIEQSELITFISSFILMIVTNYLVYRLWPTYTSKYQIRKYNRIISFALIFFIFIAVNFYVASRELAVEMGMDYKTFLTKLAESINQEQMSSEDIKKIMKVFEKI